MAKKKRKSQAKGYKPPSLSEIFEPLIDGWQNIGDSLVWDPNSEYEFGKQMTVKDAKRFRKEYSDPTDVDGSGRRGTISKEYEIAPSKPKTEVSQNEIAEKIVSEETEPSVGKQLGNAFSLSDMDEEGKRELAIFDQKLTTERTKLIYALESTKTLNAATDNSYTTNFREAMRNANTTQVYADTIDSETPLEKSNVFTKAAMDYGMYKAGDTLGVMGRSQRRAYDEAVAQALADQNKIETTEDSVGTQLGKGLTENLDPSKASVSEGVSFNKEDEND